MFEYIILSKKKRSDLVNDVNTCLGRGWVIIGGPYVDKAGNTCQAMGLTVKSEEYR